MCVQAAAAASHKLCIRYLREEDANTQLMYLGGVSLLGSCFMALLMQPCVMPSGCWQWMLLLLTGTALLHDAAMYHAFWLLHDAAMCHAFWLLHDAAMCHALSLFHDAAMCHALSLLHGAAMCHALWLLHDAAMCHALWLLAVDAAAADRYSTVAYCEATSRASFMVHSCQYSP